MSNQQWSIQIDLTGVKPLGLPFERFEEGGYQVTITDATEEQKKAAGKQGTNIVVTTRVTEQHRNGEERRVYMARPEPGETDSKKIDMFKRNVVSLLLSAGYTQQQIQGVIGLTRDALVGKTAFIYVEHDTQTTTNQMTGEVATKDRENIRFISQEDYVRNRAVDLMQKKPAQGAAPNGNGLGVTAPAAAPNLPPIQSPGAVTPLATAPAAPAPAAGTGLQQLLGGAAPPR